MQSGGLYRRVISRSAEQQCPRPRKSISGRAAVLRPAPVNYAFHVRVVKPPSAEQLTAVGQMKQLIFRGLTKTACRFV